MKKLLFILPLLALVAICSCNKQKPETHENAILCDTLHVDDTDSAYEVGPYEAYIDSLFATSDEYQYPWEGFDDFKDIRQKKFVNYIYYADSYEVYFGLLNEYYPVKFSNIPTEYDRYLASLKQIDQLLDFPGDEAGTYGMYLYDDYGQQHDEWCIQKFTDLSRISNFYSVEVDSAWNTYCRAMLTVVDSVLLERPACLGTISYMEKYGFIDNHKEAQKNALLDELYGKERMEYHATISDEMISKAFQEVRSICGNMNIRNIKKIFGIALYP